MKSYLEEYKSKLVSPDEAAKIVQSGDTIQMSGLSMNPILFDIALAKRVNELYDVILAASSRYVPTRTVEADPEGKHILYQSAFMSPSDRKLAAEGLCFLTLRNYSFTPEATRLKLHAADKPRRLIGVIGVTPMDKYGFFNFSCHNSNDFALAETADVVILEVNDQAPWVMGGEQECIHISQVDYIIEGSYPMLTLPPIEPTDIEKKMADYIVEYIEDGCCIQLGIGGLPGTIGKILADSDLKDLGVYSEMLGDSFMEMFEKGRITGSKKAVDKYKMTCTFVMGTKELYEWIHYNPVCASYPADICNDPKRIALNDKMIAINNALEVDLTGQISSESIGFTPISGPGGQLDFSIGAFNSRGGKSFICISSTTKDKDGNRVSRIVPYFRPGTVVDVPRTFADFIVTEYGAVSLKGRPTWARAEKLISIAHPDYRDELVKEAEKAKIWRRTNKQDN